MSTRKIGAIIFGITILMWIGVTIYRIIVGKDVEFDEIIYVVMPLIMMFFSTVTWGNKKEKDGIFPDEELGQKITEKSSKISYFILLALLLVAVVVDGIVNGKNNVFLLGILGLGMIILPIVEFFVAKKYQ